jgi:acyl carrier protein
MYDTAQRLRQFITENFLFGQEHAFSDEDSLLEQGIIDSTGVLELVGFLENEYHVAIEDEELVPENLDSISNLMRFLAAKCSLSPVLSAEVDYAA